MDGKFYKLMIAIQRRNIYPYDCLLSWYLQLGGIDVVNIYSYNSCYYIRPEKSCIFQNVLKTCACKYWALERSCCAAAHAMSNNRSRAGGRESGFWAPPQAQKLQPPEQTLWACVSGSVLHLIQAWTKLARLTRCAQYHPNRPILLMCVFENFDLLKQTNLICTRKDSGGGGRGCEDNSDPCGHESTWGCEGERERLYRHPHTHTHKYLWYINKRFVKYEFMYIYKYWLKWTSYISINRR